MFEKPQIFDLWFFIFFDALQKEQNKGLDELNLKLQKEIENLTAEVNKKTIEIATLQQQHKEELHNRRIESDEA